MSILRVWRRSAMVVLWTVASALLTVGCGQSSDPEIDRIRVFGAIEWQGGSVDEGTISLYPISAKGTQTGSKRPSASTAIRGGRYEFTARNGPTVGPHRAEVILYAGEKPRKPGGGSPPPNMLSRDWTFKVDIPEDGPFEKNFTLD
jgi:hypothetical protein